MTTPFAKLAIAAQEARPRRGGPSLLVPVLGSGFVTQAVLDGARARGRRTRVSPVDWLTLLREVAQEFALENAERGIESDVPGQTTLLWDSMLAELALRDSGNSKPRAAHRWEDELRGFVAERLADDVASVRLAKPFVRSFLRLGFRDVLTFNFDSVLLGEGSIPVQRSSGGAARASLAASVGKTCVWFPHGHCSDQKSIVLGAHAYGARLVAMQAAFDEHARQKSPRKTTGHESWVATMLERPLLFVGLSLTREEWTIWWLLAQRARFLARRPALARPPVFIFARRPAPSDRLESHGAFATLSRASELLGLTLCTFSDFKTGWAKLRRALEWG